MAEAAEEFHPGPGPDGPGTRLGHAPVLLRTIAHKILNTHLERREQLLEEAAADLQTVEPDEARIMILAMVAAAHADGAFDDSERARIRAAMHNSSIPIEDRAALEADFGEPPGLEGLLRQVDGPRSALRFYVASMHAIDRSRSVSRLYLAYLAQRLGLAADQVTRLNRVLGMPRW
jgi:uncharacterized membrane protein YebE (DUF533 family)